MFLAGKLSNHAARVARSEHAFRKIPRHYAAGAHNRARADAHAGANDRTTADPNICPDLNRASELSQVRRSAALIG